MQYLVTAQEMKEYDNYTIEEIGIPGLVLMERAALEACKVAMSMLESSSSVQKRAFLIAGYGNNGGDGLALARMLSERRIKVEILCVGNPEKATESWKAQRKILEHFPVEFVKQPSFPEYDIIIDALFGVGLSRTVEGEYARAINCMNALYGKKLALDIPSGIHSDTGAVLGAAVKADVTVTFGFLKRGLMLFPGCEYAGEVITADIGITDRAFHGKTPGMFALDGTAEELLPVRKADGNKGTFGKVLLIAGSYNMAGAAVLAARASFRIGAGMVKVITPKENRVILQTCIPEAMLGTADTLTQSLAWADVIAIGPGLGRSDEARKMLHTVLFESRLPMVIDADALFFIAEDISLRQGLKDCGAQGRKLILTPHPGELSGLMHKPVSALKGHLYAYGSELAMELQTVVAAKDARTVICSPKGELCLNLTGNSGMGTAGSGDVLTGMIAGLLAQGMQAFEAACVGVCLHGLYGDRVAAQVSEYYCMAGDLVSGQFDPDEEQSPESS